MAGKPGRSGPVGNLNAMNGMLGLERRGGDLPDLARELARLQGQEHREKGDLRAFENLEKGKGYFSNDHSYPWVAILSSKKTKSTGGLDGRPDAFVEPHGPTHVAPSTLFSNSESFLANAPWALSISRSRTKARTMRMLPLLLPSFGRTVLGCPCRGFVDRL